MAPQATTINDLYIRVSHPTTSGNVSTTRPKTLRQLRQEHPSSDLRYRRLLALGSVLSRACDLQAGGVRSFRSLSLQKSVLRLAIPASATSGCPAAPVRGADIAAIPGPGCGGRSGPGGYSEGAIEPIAV